MKKRTAREMDIRYGRIPDAMRRTSLGRDTVKRLAKECGALVKVGSICLVDFSILDGYLAQLRSKGDD